VRLDNTSDFWNHAPVAGGQVRFTLTDGTTLLNFEVERYDTTNKIAAWHVQVPTHSASVNTQYQVNYDTATHTDGSNASATWDSNFVAVHHLSVNQPGGAFIDSTGNYNGTATATTDTAGRIDRGRHFAGSDKVAIGTVTELGGASTCTIEYTGQKDSAGTLLNAGNYNGDFNSRTSLNHWSDGNVYPNVSNGSAMYGVYSLNDALSHHYVMVFDGGLTGDSNRLKLYIDGVIVTMTYPGSAISATLSAAKPFNIGQDSTANTTGMMDEHTISSTPRSADWVMARYHSGLGDLQTIGAEQTGGGGGGGANWLTQGYWWNKPYGYVGG